MAIGCRTFDPSPPSACPSRRLRLGLFCLAALIATSVSGRTEEEPQEDTWRLARIASSDAGDALLSALDAVEDDARFQALAGLYDAASPTLVPFPSEAGGEHGLLWPAMRVAEALLARERDAFAASIDARWGGSARARFRAWRSGDARAGEDLAARYALLPEGGLALRLLAGRDLEAGRVRAASRRFRRWLRVWPNAPAGLRARVLISLADAVALSEDRSGLVRLLGEFPELVGIPVQGERRGDTPAATIARLDAAFDAPPPVAGGGRAPLPAEPLVLWSRRLDPREIAPDQFGHGPSPSLGAIAGDGEDLILHEGGVVRRIEAMTGRVRWRFPVRDGSERDDRALLRYWAHDLPLRDVTIAGDLVLAVMGLPGGTGAWRDEALRTSDLSALPREARLRLVALDRRTGALRWATGRAADTHPVLGDTGTGVASPPRVVGDSVFVQFARRSGGAEIHLARLALATGRALWVTQLATGESGRTRTTQPGRRRFARARVLALPWGARPGYTKDEILAQPHAGFTAGVDPDTGVVRWIRRMPRYAPSKTVAVWWGFTARNAPLAHGGTWWLAPMDGPRLLGLEAGTGRLRLARPDGARPSELPWRHLLGLGRDPDGAPCLLLTGSTPATLRADHGGASFRSVQAWTQDGADRIGRPWSDGTWVVRVADGLAAARWREGGGARVSVRGIPTDGDVYRVGDVWLVLASHRLVAVAGTSSLGAWVSRRLEVGGDPDERAVAAAFGARLARDDAAMDAALLRARDARDPGVLEAVLTQAEAAGFPQTTEARLARVDVLLELPTDLVARPLRQLLEPLTLMGDTDEVVSRLDRWIAKRGDAWIERRRGLEGRRTRADVYARGMRQTLTGAWTTKAEREALEAEARAHEEAGRPGLAAACVADLRLTARTRSRVQRTQLRESRLLVAAGDVERAAGLQHDLSRGADARVRGEATRELAQNDRVLSWEPALPGPARSLALWPGSEAPASSAELRALVVPHLVGPGAAMRTESLLVFRGLDSEIWEVVDGERRFRLPCEGAGWFGGALQGVAAWLPEGGVLVTSLVAREPADAAGLAVHDWIVGWDGARLASGAAFMAAVARSGPGIPVEVEARRQGARVVQSFTPGRRPLEQGGVVLRDEIYASAEGRLLVPDRMTLSWIDPASGSRDRLWSWRGESGVVEKARVLHGQAVVGIRRIRDADRLVAVDLETGASRWEQDVEGRIESIQAVGSAVLAVTREPAALHLLDARDGRIRIACDILEPSWDPFRRVRTPHHAVAVSTGWVWYVDRDGGELRALNSTTGEEVWSEPVVTVNDVLPLAAAGGIVAFAEMGGLRVIVMDPVTGEPARMTTWARDLAITRDTRLWIARDHVFVLEHGRRREARVHVLRVDRPRDGLRLSPMPAPFRGRLNWPVGSDHYVDSARLSPEGLVLTGSRSGGQGIRRATAWISISGRRWVWNDRRGEVLETVRHAPGRFGGRLHWATDRGLTLVPLRGTGITERR